MQSKINKKLCTLAVVCVLTVLPTFADNQCTEKDIQKSVVSMNMNNLSAEYLSQVEQLLYKQMHEAQDYDSALVTLNYFIDASKKYYGANNSLTGFAYVAKERYYSGLMIPNLAKESLDKTYEFYLLNQDSNDLKSNVLGDYVNYYSSIEQPYDSIKYLNELLKIQPKNANTYLAIGQIYLNMKNYKEAENLFKKYYEELQKDTNTNFFQYHISMANLYQSEGKLELFADELNEAENILKQKDNNIDAKVDLNRSKIQYYIDALEFDKALSVLNETEELLSKYGKDVQKKNLIQQYIDCYKDKQDLSNFTKYAKKIDKTYDSLPQESLIPMTLAEKKIDIYKDLNKLDKADEYANTALAKLEPVKEFVPYLYGKYLKKAAEVKIQQDKTQEAKILLDKAIESHKKAAPETAYEFYEVYKTYGELYNRDGNLDEALNYYNKAANILKPLIGEKGNDLADIYSSLANIYRNTDKLKEAVLMADKAYEIKEHCSGKNHVKTLESKLNKYHTYKAAGLDDEASKIISEINIIVSNGQSIGDKPGFFYSLNLENGHIALQNKQFDAAIIYANKALEFAKTKNKKIEVYNLLYQIYSESGNKLKAYKYKKLGNIE